MSTNGVNKILDNSEIQWQFLKDKIVRKVQTGDWNSLKGRRSGTFHQENLEGELNGDR
jgi:hypothetical protein